jgi:hypothetical protein
MIQCSKWIPRKRRGSISDTHVCPCSWLVCRSMTSVRKTREGNVWGDGLGGAGLDQRCGPPFCREIQYTIVGAQTTGVDTGDASPHISTIYYCITKAMPVAVLSLALQGEVDGTSLRIARVRRGNTVGAGRRSAYLRPLSESKQIRQVSRP